MLVTHFTSELFGGAGVAAQRLHAALREQEVESRLYYDLGTPLVPDCVPAFQNRSFFWRNVVALARSWRNRRNAPHGFVTSPRWVRRTALQSLGRMPAVVNLHWISRWIDVPSFFASLPAVLPVVWSLHDMNPLTGGCHHADDCDRFTNHCAFCPKLKRPGPRDDTYQFFEIKRRAYGGKNLHVVGNSTWTTTQAKRSALMREAKSFHTIPLGIDVRQYAPVDRRCARQALGIREDRFVVAFACADFSDRNKGAELLVEALTCLKGRAALTLVAFGAGRLPAMDSIEVLGLGPVNCARLQSVAYSAADVFALPSRIESFGLTALEAMACGTPVVAFHTGGVPDLVSDGETGLLEPEVGSAAGLARKLEWMLAHPAERGAMGAAARTRVERDLTDKLMAQRYVELYRQVAADS